MKPDQQEKGQIERSLRDQGYDAIIGVDEVGRGCLAGDVYASAVVLSPTQLEGLSSNDKDLIRDSKQLSAAQRMKAKKIIEGCASSISVQWASVEEIESQGILPACHLAMKRAIKIVAADIPGRKMVLVDGNIPLKGLIHEGVELPQKTVVKGDSKCFCIAAASILAKIARDNYMLEMAGIYPGYGFEKNVGYGTKIHRQKIAECGFLAIHRKNFAPMKNMLGNP